MIFGKVDGRHRPNQDIMQCYCNRRGYLVTSANPCHRDRQQRLKRIQRCEAEKNSDGGPKCNGVRRIGDGHQCHVMLGKHLLEVRHRPGQAGTVAGRNREISILHEVNSSLEQLRCLCRRLDDLPQRLA